MTPSPASRLEAAAANSSPGGARDRAFEALLACAFLKQQMDLRLTTHRQLSRQSRRARAQDEAQQVLGQGLDGVLVLLAERTATITGASGVAIALAEPRGVVCRAAAGNAPPPGSTIDLRSGFSALAILTGEVLRCNDTQSDDRVDAASCAQLGIRSLVAVPLLRKDAVIGLVEVFSDQANQFAEREVNVLKLVAGFVLEAVDTGVNPATVEMPRTVATQVIPLPELPIKSPTEAAATTAAVPPAESWEEVEPNILAAPDEDENEAGTDWARFFPVLIAIAFIAAIVAGGFGWRHFGATRKAPVPVTAPEQKIDQVTPPTAALQTVADSAGTGATGAAPSSSASSGSAEPAKITDLRHWSAPQSCTVIIELAREAPFLAHRLHGPERIYFDVQDSQLAPELKDKAFAIGDGIVERVRVASPEPGVSRVVLDTTGEREFSTSVSTEPYRIIIEVRK